MERKFTVSHMLRQALKRVDHQLLHKKISNLLLKKRRNRITKLIQRQKLESIEISYKKDLNPLSELFDKYGSDKGTNKNKDHVYDWHPNNYADLYTMLFEGVRETARTVFECGIGTNNPNMPSSMGERGKPGASLKAWRDYFSNAEIFGADIDASILFQEERIKTGYMDQCDPNSIKMFLKKFNLNKLDVVIDDGLHTFQAAKTLFENTYPVLAKGGFYIIEDIHPSEAEHFTKYFNSLKENAQYAIFTTSKGLPVGNLIWLRKKV